MTPVIQVMIGMGLGLVAALLLTPLAIGYVNNQRNPAHGNRKRTEHEFFDAPGQRCPICMETMTNARDMQYLNCGHALHDNCCRELRNHFKQCPTCRASI